MNKLPAKQIYLLTIIIVGIIALSVYSTYALFTFESSTSNVVSIHTPTSLQISENIYEYQQLTVEPNSVTTTDISIYNTFEYDVCYSIWYKIIGNEEIKDKIQIFQKSEDALTTSGTLTSLQNIKVTVVIINDNEESVKINLGTLGEELSSSSCSLNLTKDKQMISSSYNNLDGLNEKILSKLYELKNVDENYLTHKDYSETLTYKENDEIYLSNKFTYTEEIFTLEKLPEDLTIKKIVEEKYLEEKEMYLCKENTSCKILYKIKKIEIEEKKKDENNPESEIEIYYHITLQDKMIGYSSGLNGMRLINQKDYIYYGDNPNNYVYFNCKNSDDIKTCELWRIVGLYYNEETQKYNAKIIKNDSIGKYQYDDTEDENLIWENSKLYKYLEEEYKLINNYEIFIDDYKQSIETLKSLDEKIKQSENKLETKINLLNLSDYINSSTCKIKEIEDLNDECIRKSWLYNIEIGQSWTSTKREEPEIIIETIEPEIENEENIEPEEELPQEENTDEETQPEEPEEITEIKTIINYTYSFGEKVTENKTTDLLEVRPVIYLKSRMILVSGDGSFENPYIIK